MSEAGHATNVWSVWWANAGDDPEITLFTDEEKARECYERNNANHDHCEMDVYCLYPEYPKKSKWVKITGMAPPEMAGKFMCERCGWRDHPYNKNARHPYCPGCGAYMTNNDGLVGGNA